MRLLAKYLRAIPTDVRAYFRPFLYGLFGGLAAVGFQAGIKVLEWVLWTQLSHIATGYFVLASLATLRAIPVSDRWPVGWRARPEIAPRWSCARTSGETG